MEVVDSTSRYPWYLKFVVAPVVLAFMAGFGGWLWTQLQKRIDGPPENTRQEQTKNNPDPTSKQSPRALMNFRDVWENVEADWKGLSPMQQGQKRYLTVTHLWNIEAHGEKQLNEIRANLLEQFRPLTTSKESPVWCDKNQTILSISLTDLKWNEEDWAELVSTYPYGLNQTSHPDVIVSRAYGTISAATNTPAPLLRFDWFLLEASSNRNFRSENLRASRNHLKGKIDHAQHRKQELSMAMIMADLHLRDVKVVERLLKENPDAPQKRKLHPLLNGGTITREVWEETPILTSAFQELARDLGLGTPVAVNQQ